MRSITKKIIFFKYNIFALSTGGMVFVIAVVWWVCPAREVTGSLVGAYREKHLPRLILG
jgi:hypothetical protein